MHMTPLAIYDTPSDIYRIYLQKSLKVKPIITMTDKPLLTNSEQYYTTYMYYK